MANTSSEIFNKKEELLLSTGSMRLVLYLAELDGKPLQDVVGARWI